jgi:hypothetical protein
MTERKHTLFERRLLKMLKIAEYLEAGVYYDYFTLTAKNRMTDLLKEKKIELSGHCLSLPSK